MNNFVLDPTDENIINTFEKDIIRRDQDVLRLVSLIQSCGSKASIALNARWGAGKTFFIKQTKMVFDAFNDFTCTYDEGTKGLIKDKCSTLGLKQEDIEPYVTVYYDAWSNDNDADPLLSLVYEIIHQINSDTNFLIDRSDGEIIKTLLGTASAIFDQVKGTKVTDFFGKLGSIKGDNPLQDIQKQKDLKELVDDFFDSLLPEKGNKLVIFIDELDRCRPDYAVKLLERCKHYFNHEGVIFVFSVNLSELQHTIKRFYGNNFDASAYLDRFFDITLTLPQPELRTFYIQMGLENGSWVFEKMCKDVIKYFNFGIRETCHYYSNARLFAYKPAHSSSTGFRYGNANALITCCVVPCLLGLSLADKEKYDSLVTGKDSSEFIKLMRLDSARNICEMLFTGEEKTSQDCDKSEVLTDKLNYLYEALFNHDFEVDYRTVTIGEIDIDGDVQEDLFSIVSGFSGYADYNHL